MIITHRHSYPPRVHIVFTPFGTVSSSQQFIYVLITDKIDPRSTVLMGAVPLSGHWNDTGM